MSARRDAEEPAAREATGSSSSGAPGDLAFEADEPLAPWIHEVAPRAIEAGVRAFRFEYTSRGDRVPGRLLLPGSGEGPFPLVLLQHGAGGSKESDYLDAARLPWVRRGAAVASIDFPLHGERASAKLGEALFASLGAPGPGDALRREFVRQALLDLRRALDALEALPSIDRHRIAYAAFSLGAIVGALFCPADPRPRAAALALGGGGFGDPELDPVHALAGFAPRPLLLLNALHDERIPRGAAEALHAAAADPKQVLWFEGGHAELPGRALKAMWLFLARELRIETDG